jgi:glucose/arabinose dehydrogenase
MRGGRIATLAAVAVGVVLLAGLGGAAACRLTDLNCHLRPAPEWELTEVAGQRGGARSLNPQLQTRRVARGLDYPTDFDFLPDGRMLVALRTGLVEMVAQGRVRPKPVLDLRNRVSIWGLRGVMALAVDPTRASPVQFYVAYSVVDPRYPSPASGKPTTFRVSRFTLRDGVASPASEKVIVGRVTGGSCTTQPTANCLPADRDHIGADIAFRPDGTLLIATGDGGPATANVQLVQRTDTLGGKILRVDRNGRGVRSNPFWNGDPDANRSKVWAYGLRNPFRLSTLTNGDVVVGDVGYNNAEELDLVRRGGDYGWPCYEGEQKTPEYRSKPFCATYYASHPSRRRAAWFVLPRPTWRTVIAGVPLKHATLLPEGFHESYAFGDWSVSKLWIADPSTSRETLLPVSRVHVIESGAAGPVRLRVGPDGALYELAINTGEIWRITAHEH